MSERKIEPRSCAMIWSTSAGHADPTDLIEILERLHGHVNDTLPGSAIVGISYDGFKLEITLKEAT